MSYVVDGTGKRVIGSSLTGLSTSSLVIIGGWFKYNSSLANANHYLGVLSEDQSVGSVNRIAGKLDTTPNFLMEAALTNVSGTTTQGTQAYTEDAWGLWAAGWGPHDGTSRMRWRWYNGTEPTITAATTNNVTVNMDEICFPGAWGSQVPFGKVAEIFTTVVSSTTVAKSFMDAMWNSGSSFRAVDHPTVTAITAANYYWPLYDDLVSDLGSSTLTNVGSGSFDTGDHPTVDHGIMTGQAVGSFCFM